MTQTKINRLNRVAGRAVGALLLLLANAGQATLVDRGRGMVYDTDRDITWLQDWNYARTSGYHVSGLMSWTEVKAWVDGLEFGGYSDWRLPTALNPDGSGPCVDFGCTGGELGHVWLTELRNTAYCGVNDCSDAPLPGWETRNTGPFINMASSFRAFYWTGTEYDSTRGWFFDVSLGNQEFGEDPMFEYAVAVRDGDVPAIPEPASLALMLAGLGAAVAASRRRSAAEVSPACGRAAAGSS